MSKSVWVVITTISSPTPAVSTIAGLARERNWGVVVVGDTKTPADWSCPGVDYLSIEDQHRRYGSLASMIPVRHYSRKNLGYLYAIEQGARTVLETDDDNIPYPSFGDDLACQIFGKGIGGSKWINVYAHYTPEILWPRGLPLDAVHEKGTINAEITSICPIQQFLADDDPDVDAIWRLIYKHPIRFESAVGALIIDKGSYVPFNSQNTAFFEAAFPLLYLPCFVSFRMTDIWRSFVAQRVLWEINGRLSFRPATVRQVRNEHDLMKDFREEIDGYVNNRKIAECLDAVSLKAGADVSEFALGCWEALYRMGTIKREELTLAELWLSKVAKL